MSRGLAALALLGAACTTPLFVEPSPPALVPGTEIVVCGERFDVGAPVVLWFEPPRYDAYATEARFGLGEATGLRYRPGRAVGDGALARRVEREGWSLATLGEAVDLFVLHYDVCGTSRTCFEVLHDRRGLSVHFLLDVDGTLYQTLDLEEQAWHAREANPRSIGVEIAQIGAYPPDDAAPLEEWYSEDADGARITLPERLGDGGVRTPGFVGRPVRSDRIRGEVQGRELEQYDFTSEQYDTLARLARTLKHVFPRIRLDVPRDANGDPLTRALTGAELAEFSGVIAHWHVSADKIDPGPAFDWERFLSAARAPEP